MLLPTSMRDALSAGFGEFRQSERAGAAYDRWHRCALGEATAVPGLEVVVVRLAGTVASTVARSILAPRRGAGLGTGQVRPLPKPASPDRLAKVLGHRLDEAYGTLPAHERTAAVDAVRDG